MVAGAPAERAWAVLNRQMPDVVRDTDGVPVTPAQAKPIITDNDQRADRGPPPIVAAPRHAPRNRSAQHAFQVGGRPSASRAQRGMTSHTHPDGRTPRGNQPNPLDRQHPITARRTRGTRLAHHRKHPRLTIDFADDTVAVAGCSFTRSPPTPGGASTGRPIPAAARTAAHGRSRGPDPVRTRLQATRSPPGPHHRPGHRRETPPVHTRPTRLRQLIGNLRRRRRRRRRRPGQGRPGPRAGPA